jgi:putative oxidoreductase
MGRSRGKTLVDGAAPLLARILLCLVFVPAAVAKTFDWQGNAEYMRSHGMPLIPLFLGAALVVEAVGTLCVVLGWYTRPAALVMAAYLVPVSLIFHRLGSSPFAPTQLLKNLGIVGGLLLVAVHGAGPWSIDGWLRRRHDDC